MYEFLGRRFYQSILVLLAVSVIVFSFLHLSGDPVLLMLPIDTPREVIESFRKEMGFDKPFIIQYLRFLKNAIFGDFGNSFIHQRPALQLVIERIPASAQLAGAAMFFAIIIGITLGVISAVRRGSLYEKICIISALIGQSVPNFWLGIILILLFGLKLKLLPIAGRGSFLHIIMPAFVLSLYTMGLLARITRSSMLETLNMEFIKTAKAKGVKEQKIILRHALLNGMIPVITVLGIQLGRVLTGAFVIEVVFAWPGVGRLAIGAVGDRDYPVVLASVFLIALVYVIVNIIIDIIYALLNPQIKYTK